MGDCRVTGALLLSGLFFYDVFWVFGTPVMVTVAKSLDAPIKLVFPRAGPFPQRPLRPPLGKSKVVEQLCVDLDICFASECARHSALLTLPIKNVGKQVLCNAKCFFLLFSWRSSTP